MSTIQTRVIAIDSEEQLEQITNRINAGEDPDAVFADLGVEIVESSAAEGELEEETPEEHAAVERAKVAKAGLTAVTMEFGSIIPGTTKLPEDVAAAHMFIQAGPDAAIERLGLEAAADAFTEAANTLADWTRETGTKLRDEQAYSSFNSGQLG